MPGGLSGSLCRLYCHWQRTTAISTWDREKSRRILNIVELDSDAPGVVLQKYPKEKSPDTVINCALIGCTIVKGILTGLYQR